MTEDKAAIARRQRSDVEDPHVALARAKYLFDRGEFASSVDAASRILAHDSDHLGAWEVRVKAEWRMGDFPAVLRSLRKLTLLNPYEPGYFLMQGDALQMLGRVPDARAAYERCIGFEGSPVRYEAMANLEELGEPAPAEFLPAGVDTVWMPLDRIDEAPTVMARPS